MAQSTSTTSMCNLIMFGSTGAGKSRTGNTILGTQAFQASSSAKSKTKEFSFQSASYKGRTLTISDTPGFHDTDGDEVQALQLVYTSFEDAFKVNKEGVNAFLYVTKYGTRFTKQDRDTLACFKTMFGQNSLEKFGILLLTHGDNFEDDQEEEGLDQTILEWCLADEIMKPFVEQFGNRVVIFNNKEKNHEKVGKNVDELMRLVDQKGDSSYTLEDFQKSSPDRAKRILEAKEPAIKKSTLVETDALLAEMDKLKSISDMRECLMQIDKTIERAKELQKEIEATDDGSGVLKEVIGNVKNVVARAEQDKHFFSEQRSKEERAAYEKRRDEELKAAKAKNHEVKRGWLAAVGVGGIVGAILLAPVALVAAGTAAFVGGAATMASSLMDGKTDVVDASKRNVDLLVGKVVGLSDIFKKGQ